MNIITFQHFAGTGRFKYLSSIFSLVQSMLRGRGGCYKHTFYGIASHQCMEATPSLACANKCVFCWRHHSSKSRIFNLRMLDWSFAVSTFDYLVML
jgi:hypothetical protein